MQKFDPSAGVGGEEAQFLLTFGGGVNETSGGNLCPRPGFPADVCKAGSEGAANGQFGNWPVASFITVGEVRRSLRRRSGPDPGIQLER